MTKRDRAGHGEAEQRQRGTGLVTERPSSDKEGQGCSRRGRVVTKGDRVGHRGTRLVTERPRAVLSPCNDFYGNQRNIARILRDVRRGGQRVYFSAPHCLRLSTLAHINGQVTLMPVMSLFARSKSSSGLLERNWTLQIISK